jgi:hypothetical protein
MTADSMESIARREHGLFGDGCPTCSGMPPHMIATILLGHDLFQGLTLWVAVKGNPAASLELALTEEFLLEPLGLVQIVMLGAALMSPEWAFGITEQYMQSIGESLREKWNDNLRTFISKFPISVVNDAPAEETDNG